MTVEQQRQAVVAEARTWLSTPYIPKARVKGGGVDCATMLTEVYGTALGWGKIELPDYSPQWHLHRSEEMYLHVVDHVMRVFGGGEVQAPEVGGIAVWQIGRTYSHGVIVLDWPCVVHASLSARCVELVNDVERYGELLNRKVRFYSPWV